MDLIKSNGADARKTTLVQLRYKQKTRIWFGTVSWNKKRCLLVSL